MSYRSRLLLQSLITLLVFIGLARALDVLASPSRLLLVAVLTMGIASLFAVIAARRHTAMLLHLREAARALAGGDLSVPPALASRGELGEIADSLRSVAEQLGARISALQTEDALLSAVIDSLNEGVIAVNADQKVVRANAAGRELLGLGGRALPFSVDVLPRQASLHRSINVALRGEATSPTEVELAGRTMALTATPLIGGGAVVALFDTTQLRRLEQIRRDFVANVSHELRTPLTVVSGFAETLAEDDPPLEQRRQFAAAIRAHTTRMQRIVDDLLDLSRMESGGWLPKPERVNLRQVADEVLAAAGRTVSDRPVMLRNDVDRSIEEAEMDRTALRQILSNLVDNSLRHTDSGEVVVFARPDAAGVRIGVRDTGSGVAPEHLSRIFERFYRVDAGRARQSGGTGLGLAIVKHLAEAHGGSVRAASEPGRGTTIEVLIPQSSGLTDSES